MEPRSDCLERAITISSVRRVIFFFDVEFRARFYSLSFWFSWDQFSATMELLHTERVNDCFRCLDVLFDAPIQEHVSTSFFFLDTCDKTKIIHLSQSHICSKWLSLHWAHIPIHNHNRDDLRDTNIDEDKTNVLGSIKRKTTKKKNKMNMINERTRNR